MTGITHSTVVTKANNPAFDVSADAWNASHLIDDNTIAIAKLVTEVQNLINGAVQSAGTNTFTGLNNFSGASAKIKFLLGEEGANFLEVYDWEATDLLMMYINTGGEIHSTAYINNFKRIKLFSDVEEANVFEVAQFEDKDDVRLYIDTNGRLHSDQPLYFRGGTDASIGLATLVAGSAVVNTTKVTANSLISLTRQTASGVLGHLHISARVAGTSFTITASGGLDTSTIMWMIVEPY